MNIFSIIEGRILDAVAALQSQDVLPGDVEPKGLTVEAPRDAAHGDVASNIAMVLAKQAGLKPRDLADLIAKQLRSGDGIEAVEIAGPGFINMSLGKEIWRDVVWAVLEQRDRFARSNVGAGMAVNVEYVSVNPTGPLHVGHCRGAVFGDALANLLDFAGFGVTREYYINDAGAQVDVLARSAYLRYREALGDDIGEIPPGYYPGDYLKPVGQGLAAEHGRALLDKNEDEWLPVVREFAIAAMMDLIRDDLETLNIHHEVFFSERSLIEGGVNAVAETIAFLKRQDLVYEGRLPPPKGKLPDDWEDREQTLFRSTNFGDDIDRALIKSDGSYTYFASDMAYHRDKFLRGFKTMIDVWGADHSGYIKRVGAAVDALTEGEGDFDVKVCQLVRLFRAGEPIRMSKRAGAFVTLRDVVDEVGSDPVRFMMLYRKNDAVLDFDFAKVTEQSRDNPVFYVQMAHARAHSVLRNAEEVFPDILEDLEKCDRSVLESLVDKGEITLMKRLAQYPRLIEGAALAHEPHRVAFYLYELASDLHVQWNRGKDLPQLRFIRSDDRGLTVARLALVKAVAHILASGLTILGVHAPHEMR